MTSSVQTSVCIHIDVREIATCQPRKCVLCQKDERQTRTQRKRALKVGTACITSLSPVFVHPDCQQSLKNRSLVITRTICQTFQSARPVCGETCSTHRIAEVSEDQHRNTGQTLVGYGLAFVQFGMLHPIWRSALKLHSGYGFAISTFVSRNKTTVGTENFVILLFIVSGSEPSLHVWADVCPPVVFMAQIDVEKQYLTGVFREKPSLCTGYKNFVQRNKQ